MKAVRQGHPLIIVVWLGCSEARCGRGAGKKGGRHQVFFSSFHDEVARAGLAGVRDQSSLGDGLIRILIPGYGIRMLHIICTSDFSKINLAYFFSSRGIE